MKHSDHETPQTALAAEVAERKRRTDKKRAVFYQRLFKLLVLVLVLLPVFDYWKFQSNLNAAFSIVQACGGRPSSIGGWPFGQENILVFDQKMTSAEENRLRRIPELKYSSSFRVHFTIQIPEPELVRLRQKLLMYVTCSE